MNEILRVEDISKKYDNVKQAVLNRLAFSVEKGKIVCLIGENGAGKSTLLRSLAGLTDVDEGKIFFKDQLLTGPSGQLVAGHPQIKLLRQDATLYPKMTVAENIRYELKAYPLNYVLERLDALISLCNLQGLEHKFPAELSGGQKQKTALARALADEPDLLLLDEPFSNTDVLQKLTLKKTLNEIFRSTDTTVLFSSHDIEEAFSLSDQIICMQQGRIIQNASPQEIYINPLNSYVADLAGICNYLKPADLPFESTGRDSDNICIRAEHITLSAQEEADFTGKIEEKYFLGSRFEYSLKTENNLNLTFYQNQDLKLYSEVSIKIAREKLMFFNN